MHGPVTKICPLPKLVWLDQLWQPKLVPLANFGPPRENVNSKQSKVARYCRFISYFANVSKVPFLLDAFTYNKWIICVMFISYTTLLWIEKAYN